MIVPSPKEYIEILPNDLLLEVKYRDTDYQDLDIFCNNIQENRSSISITLGGGNYGLLGGIAFDSKYALIILGAVFVGFVHPEGPPVVQNLTTSNHSGIFF